MKNFYLLLIVFCFCSCQKRATLFQLLEAEETGIDFNNLITETSEFNILTEEYIFNGGGVAVADFDKNGLPDLFFTGNMVSNELYLNQGSLKFEKVTEAAQLQSEGFWSTGVAVIDLNADGWLDLYIAGAMHEDNRSNRLYLNQGLNKQGVPVFIEKAAEYGIDDPGNSMGAAFIDYDRDGDLDLYVLNNEQNETIPTNYRKKIVDGTAPSNDKLYQNNGDGTFTDVTLKAGIVYEGFGLSVTPLDLNKDQWIDLYITNDYLTNDLIYINQKDGTFKNEIEDYLLHQSKFSMGSDASDFNHDGYTDLISLDMLGESHERRKTTISKSFFFQNVLNKKWGYQDQHMRNMLFKNNGNGLPFSEIGQFSGVYQTDWSWSPLFADFDNDGQRDLLITNGFPRDITDMDFANYRLQYGTLTPVKTLLDSIPIVKISNYAFKKNADLTFSNVSEGWGLGKPSFSNGASFSDLDLDGDLDYVVNNINDPAFIFENKLNTKEKQANYIQIELSGSQQNPLALGAKVTVWFSDDKLQYQEQQLTRGYMSSVDPILYFGLGEKKEIKKIEVLWPDGSLSTVKDPSINQKHRITYESAKKVDSLHFPFIEKKQAKSYQEVAEKYQIDFIHREKNIQDFFKQRLLPHKISQNGPCLEVGDLNGDQLEDFIIGSSSSFSPQLFFQTESSLFNRKSLFTNEKDKAYEVEDLTLFDADQDGDLDLYLVSGGNEFEAVSEFYRDRLLLNDGQGNFIIAEQALPDIRTNGCVVLPLDYDLDGDQDLFIGGYNKPGAYPLSDKSYLLKNTNGIFEIVTESVLPSLDSFGLLTAAQTADLDSDGRADLILVGEYSPVTILLNKEQGFQKIDSKVLEESSGLWRSIEIIDLDKDGDLDFLVGNLGKNNMLSISPQNPLIISTKDVDNNGTIDPLIFNAQTNRNGELKMYPTQFWDNLSQQSPRFRQEFNSYRAFSRASFDYYQKRDFLHRDSLLYAAHDESKWIENLGNSEFKLHDLPASFQLGPINDFFISKTGDQQTIFAIGNDFGGAPFEGNSDAFQGTILEWNKEGKHKVIHAHKSGFHVYGDAREIKEVNLKKGKKLLLVTQNQGRVLAFEKR